jgi:stage IV sporulation protein B
LKFKKLLPLLLVLTLVFAFTTPAFALEQLPPLIPMGSAVGLRINSDGALIIGLNNVDGTNISPASEAGLHSGDIVTYIGSEKIDSVEECRQLINDSHGEPISVRVSRNGKELQFQVNPVVTEDGSAELGVWLRDAIAGIGTLTFIEPNSGMFGALGHSISDGDTGTLLPLKAGNIMLAEVIAVAKGESGIPGQLQGSFYQTNIVGALTKNTESGVFGRITKSNFASKPAIATATRSEIKVGPATILSNISGKEVKEYTIEITRVYPENSDRDMLITVTDPELIKATGGIVQGMSGSPIIQNGKIVGAVTHVLVSDPTKGYAISIERMLSEMQAQ